MEPTEILAKLRGRFDTKKKEDESPETSAWDTFLEKRKQLQESPVSYLANMYRDAAVTASIPAINVNRTASELVNNPSALGQKALQVTADYLSRQTDPANTELMLPIGQIGPLYHGSPYKFSKFSNEAIGSGEGAQAFGYGHYLTDDPNIARHYAETHHYNTGDRGWDIATRLMMNKGTTKESAIKELIKRKSTSTNQEFNNAIDTAIGHIQNDTYLKNRNYTTTVNKGKPSSEDIFLEWDKPVLSSKLKDAILSKLPDSSNIKYIINNIPKTAKDLTEADLYKALVKEYGDSKASSILDGLGITGIKYRAGSLSGIEDSKAYNYVIFDPERISIDKIE